MPVSWENMNSSPLSPSTSAGRFPHSDLRNIPPGMPSESRDRTLALAHDAKETQCMDCISECRQPSCPSIEMTDECTDECRVIPCHDLSHVEFACPIVGRDPECDSQCDSAFDCSACTEYLDLLQCCSYPVSDMTNAPISWDMSMCSLLCHRFDQNLSRDGDGESHALSTPIDWSYPLTPTSHNALASSTLFQGGNGPNMISLQNPPNTCLWGACNQLFSSQEDLANHVNTVHLRPPSAIRIPGDLFSTNQSSGSAGFDYACHWADCEQYASPGSLAGPSTGSQHDALGLLSLHLLQDHLRCPTNTLTPPENNPSEKAATITDSKPTPPVSPSPSSVEVPTVLPHDCSGTHRCHWGACNAVFTSCDELMSHLTTGHVGSGKAQYDCLWRDCNRHGNRGFSSKQKICRHLQSHTGHRPFQCEECKQFFSEAATLQQHMRRHTQEKPYVCDHPACGKAFAVMGALTIHMRKHNGDKPFKCKYCDRAFAESSNLSKHLRTHTGDRPYNCGVEGCGKSFARPDQLTRHMGVHRKKSDLAEAYS